ncbi:PP2C family protein-serine/threonine phosphatase [Streptomyces sp. NPDC057638]|uniref:PP2C family protein-serine/threonine phosphatase n=1 Tax=Streptomyces sp. NPDC057638 TaxID=3346190 RepID=UPI0036A13BE0
MNRSPAARATVKAAAKPRARPVAKDRRGRPAGGAVPHTRGRRRCPPIARLRRLLPVGVPAVCGAALLTWRVALPSDHPESLGERLVAGFVLLSVSTGLALGVHRQMGRELRRVRAVAHAAQAVLLRPLPPRLDGLTLAARQIAADRAATVGGDLYEAVATAHGVRVVIGDVRGHGLPALGAVATVLGAFREAAYDEPDLGGVLRRLDRALLRRLRERTRAAGADASAAEEFVTVLLMEIDHGGRIRALNCGHPWPYRFGPRTRPMSRAVPLPPLGLFPLPAALPPYPCGRLLPGESLLLHTDGVTEARDASGAFFALEPALAHSASGSPESVVARVSSALLRHTSGRLSDDVALVALRNDRVRVGTGRRRPPRPHPESWPQGRSGAPL